MLSSKFSRSHQEKRVQVTLPLAFSLSPSIVIDDRRECGAYGENTGSSACDQQPSRHNPLSITRAPGHEQFTNDSAWNRAVSLFRSFSKTSAPCRRRPAKQARQAESACRRLIVIALRVGPKGKRLTERGSLAFIRHVAEPPEETIGRVAR